MSGERQKAQREVRCYEQASVRPACRFHDGTVRKSGDNKYNYFIRDSNAQGWLVAIGMFVLARLLDALEAITAILGAPRSDFGESMRERYEALEAMIESDSSGSRAAN